VAGQLLNTLKGSGTKPAASHEARLGIMVITILVFAFGFLVYHKMDMHQRKLTQAAIAPNGKVHPDVPVNDMSAGLLSQPSVAAATDPMVHIEDLSDGSPFSDAATATMDLTPTLESNEEPFASLDEPLTPQSLLAEAKTQANVTEASEPAFAFDEPAEHVVFDEPIIAMAEPSTAKDDFFPDPEVREPEAATPAVVIETTVELDNSFLSLDSASDASIEFPDTLSLDVDERRSVASSVADNAFDLSVPEPAFVPAESVKNPEEELVLLALAEPQQGNGFSDGFLLEESTASQPSKPVFKEPAEFPVFSNPAVESRPGVSQPRRASESRGFNAVKNPGGRKDGHTIRTAAGSGSDGKFSLAAFNYQNGASPAAPDDGSTFNSTVVQDGDNYTKISKRMYGTVKYFSALAVFNQHRIPVPKNMRPGMVVLVPEKEMLEERYPELFVDSQPEVPEVAEFFLLEDGSPVYRVGERETISQIAERFLGRSSRWIEIYRLNQSVLKDPNKLKAGLILALPADATEVNVVP
jgi:nucleoid-associated protein YgaU